MRSRDRDTLVGRAELALIGALAGLSMWALIEKAEEVLTNPHLFLGVASGVAGFFAVMLGLSGPAAVRRAGVAALALALPAAALVVWASLRFDTLAAFFDAGHPVAAWAVLLFVGTPFLGAWLQDGRGSVEYARLFDCTWSLVVRYSAAWLFVGVFWGVLFLSDALLQIVGVGLIEDLLEIDPVPHVLNGVMLGLGLAVVHEMRDYISPYLVLRLLRLLVPVMLGVVVVFVGALLLRDAGDLFGELSPAATLMAVALGMVSLVSVALDKRDADAVRMGWMRSATAALAVLVVVPAALGAYAVWLRVDQHGWTPERLMAAVLAGFTLAYAASYALSVALRGGWMARIRRVNVAIAAGWLAMAALWLSPVLNAERISAASQVARVLEGRVTPQQAAFFELAHEWGRPGRAALERLKAQAGAQDTVLQGLIAEAEAAETRHGFETRGGDDRAGKVAALRTVLTLWPEGTEVADAALAALPDYRLDDWLALCRARPDPGCVMVLAEFDPGQDGREGLIFLPGRGTRYDVVSLRETEGALLVGRYLERRTGGPVSAEDVRALIAGAARIAPSSRRSLWIGETELLPEP